MRPPYSVLARRMGPVGAGAGCKTRTHARAATAAKLCYYTPGHENFPRHWHILMKDKYPNLDRTITS